MNVIQVEYLSADYVTVILAGDVSLTDAMAAFATFTVSTAPVQEVIEITPSQYQVGIGIEVEIGAPWAWTNDGGVSTPPINLPASGLVVPA